MKKSINQIRLEFDALATAHDQINTFFWGDLLRAWKEQEVNYPLMCAYYPSGQMLTNQTELQFVVVIADKHYKDWNVNLNEVESDTLQICRDIFNVVNSSARWQKLGRVDTCTVGKFINDTGDEVAGHTMTFTFRLRDNSGVCGLPISDYDFDQSINNTNSCSPVEYTILDESGNTLYSGSVDSGGTLSQIINNSTVTIKDDSNNTLHTVSVDAEGSATQVITDSTAVLKDTAGSTISTTSINAQASADITAPDGNITLNSVAMSTVESGGTENILVLQSNDMTQVGSKQGTHWRIDDSNVTNSDGSYDVNVKAEDSLVLPDSQINVNGVDQGDVVSVKTVDVNITDGTNPVTPDAVSLSGNTLTVQVPAGSCPDYDAELFISVTGITDATQQAAIRALVTELKDEGLWPQLAAIYPFVGGNSISHKFNLKDPRDHNSAFRLFFGGGWIHDGNGITGNGINTYADTFITGNANLELQSGSFGVYIRNLLSGTLAYEIGSGGTGWGICSRFTNDRFYGMYGTFSFTANTNTQKMFSVSRTNSRTRGFINDMQVIDLEDTPSLQALTIKIGAISPSARFSEANIAFAYIGEGLSNSEITTLYNIVQAFQTTLGRQV